MKKSLDQVWKEMREQKMLESQRRANQENALFEQREIARQSYLRKMNSISQGSIYNNTINEFIENDYIEDYFL
jgi:hypothetical protein